MYFLLNSSVANSFLFCFFSSRAVLLLPPSLSLSLCPLYTPLPQPTPPHPRTHTCSRFLTLEMVSDQRLSLSWRLDEWVQRDRLLKSSYCIDCLWYQVSAHREFNCKKKKSIYSKSKQSSYFISAMVATCYMHSLAPSCFATKPRTRPLSFRQSTGCFCLVNVIN